ncbi:MAG: hypothetical protein WD740_01020 [Anaerolineales bacterium]
MPSLYEVLRYIHVLAGFSFLLGHGGSMFVAFQLKKEKEPERMKAMLDISAAAWPTMMLSLVALLLAGIGLAFLTSAWGRGWVWASLVLLLALTIWMFLQGSGVYHPLRKMLGMEWMIQGKPQPVEKARPLAEIQAHIAKTRPRETLIIGMGGFALILWLMMSKPF